MKFLSFLLASGASAVQYENFGFVGNTHIAGEIADALVSNNLSGRKMENVCSELEPISEQFLESIYEMSFDCSCFLSSSYRLQCNSMGKICCGGFCGSIQWMGEFSSYLDPTSEETCIQYEGGLFGQDLTGRELCSKGYYSYLDFDSCESRIDGERCNSCEVCDNLPYPLNNAQYLVADCSNIEGFEHLDYQCEDIDTTGELLTEVEELQLQCEGRIYVRSGGFTINPFTVGATMFWVAAAAAMLGQAIFF